MVARLQRIRQQNLAAGVNVNEQRKVSYASAAGFCEIRVTYLMLMNQDVASEELNYGLRGD
jgi:hypothetical protein